MTKEEVVQILLTSMLHLNEASLYDAIEDLGTIAEVLTNVSNDKVPDYVNAFLMTYEQEEMIPMQNRKCMVEGIIYQMHGQEYPSNLNEEEYRWFMQGVHSYQESTTQNIKKRTTK